MSGLMNEPSTQVCRLRCTHHLRFSRQLDLLWQISWINAHIIYGSASSAVENPGPTVSPSIKPVDRPQDGLNALALAFWKILIISTTYFSKAVLKILMVMVWVVKTWFVDPRYGWGRIILKVVKKMEFALFKPSIVGYLLTFPLSVQTHYPPNSVF